MDGIRGENTRTTRLYDLPLDEPLVTVEDDYPATLEESARRELVSLWHDLADARRNGINTGWSIRCGNIAFRIVRLSRLVGTTRWDEVSVYLLVDGVYERIHRENGLEYEPVEWGRVHEIVARREALRTPAERTVTCPVCAQAVRVVQVTRTPRETSYDDPSVWAARTYEPGLTATVELSCGDSINGNQIGGR